MWNKWPYNENITFICLPWKIVWLSFSAKLLCVHLSGTGGLPPCISLSECTLYTCLIKMDYLYRFYEPYFWFIVFNVLLLSLLLAVSSFWLVCCTFFPASFTTSTYLFISSFFSRMSLPSFSWNCYVLIHHFIIFKFFSSLICFSLFSRSIYIYLH